MVYLKKDIILIEGGLATANNAIFQGKYKKVSHGLYVDQDQYISELEQLFARYPRATLTLQSAFEYYDLSDYIPEHYYIATPYNSHTIQNKKVKQFYMDEKIMEIGRVKVETKYGCIFIFDKERMLIELFRLKNKFSHSYFMETVQTYRVLKNLNLISLSKISDYCLRMPKGEKIIKQIQEMI